MVEVHSVTVSACHLLAIFVYSAFWCKALEIAGDLIYYVVVL